ncbi:hypothetical protein [Shewanella mangrovisoli]|uniref:Uncharacterized protein n=1 Tax=Shewanella mangrovisoli TaxID=2864211 RepID=A0ABV4VIR3_9GAMM
MSNTIRQKVSRFISKSLDMQWPEGTVDFENSSFIVDGIKPLIQVQDDIEAAFIWCWSLKDYMIKQLLVSNSQITRKSIEDEINTYKCLVLCSDVANRLKHNELRESRSNQYAKLSVVQKIQINKDNVSMIQKLDGYYFITPSNGDCVKVKANIVNSDDKFLVDAYECLKESLEAWAEIHSKFSNS